MSVNQADPPRAPRGLGASGRAFWRKLTAVFEFEDAKIVVLREVCRALDGIDELERVLAEDGTTVTSKSGAIKTHPHVAELRQQRAAVARLIGALHLPDDDDETPRVRVSYKSANASKAAQIRWEKERARA